MGLINHFGRPAWRRFRQAQIDAREVAGDRRLAISTHIPRPRGQPDHDERNARYEPVPYAALAIVADRLGIGPDDVVYDVGCGMGRAVCYFAQLAPRSCVGIELDVGLCEQAQANADGMSGRGCPIEIRNTDAMRANFDGATAIFMYNPFGAEVMENVLDAIDASRYREPRPIQILYLNPVQRQVFERRPGFRISDQFTVGYNLGSMQGVVWRQD